MKKRESYHEMDYESDKSAESTEKDVVSELIHCRSRVYQ